MATEIVTTDDRDEAAVDIATYANDVAQALIRLSNAWVGNQNILPEGFGEEGFPFDASVDEVAFAALSWAERVAVEAAEVINPL